jgi:RNA polymerase sigma-70 factor (ECF subfamily)
MIMAIAHSQLHDQHLAEDAAQETFAVACQQLSKLKHPERFPQWLGTICRRTSQRIHRLSPQVAPLQEDPPQDGSSFEEAANKDAKKRLQNAVFRLSRSQHEIYLCLGRKSP